MRPRTERLERLPEQYFTALLGRVQEAAARDGEPLVDLGRGNPEVGPPAHVAERLAQAARDPSAHGYAPFRGLPELREAIAERYRTHYGVELDPEGEVAVVPGTKSAIVELAVVLANRGDTIALPDPGYPDYFSGVALAGAKLATVTLDEANDWNTDFSTLPRNDLAAVYLNFPSNPVAVVETPGSFHYAIQLAAETGAAIVHDFAYGDLVYDGRKPASFLAQEGAKDVGVEMFSMSKTYGMAGWRLGFVVGNAEIVERVNLLADHIRAGIFRGVQEAGIAALTEPQDSVAERVNAYRRRRDRVLEVIPDGVCQGTFFVWFPLPEGWTAERILDELRVAVAPGEGFGSRGAGWARLSLAVTDETLDLGLERLARVFA
ncbi:MAG: aminotransferase class I/II-fold pyridoxal phosphate-dependent enzyme [Actinomycetota bacterium]|nr:aminotransferase class I/II-fold pyridoxal phosphate-dependent enzyme [Actinomycetota bacterium]